MKKEDYDFLANLVEKRNGWEFFPEYFYVLDKKVSAFVRENGYINVDALMVDIRAGNKLLIERLSEELAYNDTSFFRDYDVFKRFSELVLPNIKEKYSAAKKLSVWSCGCSTGQEVYSVLIALKKTGFLGEWSVNLIGTDFSSKAVSFASKGFYSYYDVQNGNNIRTIVDNFNQTETGWVIKPEIAQYVEFRKYNLLEIPLFNNKFDIVFCRNTIKYFTMENQSKIIENIHSTQPAGGLFYSGLNEKIHGLEEFYEKVSGFECLYQAKSLNNKKAR
ncbi:MAG: CheR family methyltransferase [Alphaproteobacteria bacterium]